MRSVLAALKDFVSAGLRPRTPLARAITLALIVKLVVVVAMKVLWFSGDARPVVDGAVMDRIIGPAASINRAQPVSPATLSKASEFLESARHPGG
jgi:hypothetical protein